MNVENNDGDVNATIALNRGPRFAYYTAPATVTADRVTARFGSLGELDYRFTPKRNGSVDCDYDTEEGEAVFDGTFVFTGENGYVHIEAPGAAGTFRIDPAPTSCARKRLARRAVPYSPTYSGEGATPGGGNRITSEREAARGQCLRLGQEGATPSCRRRLPRRKARRDVGGPRGRVDRGIGCLSLGPQEGHSDTASAEAFHRLGDLHAARQRSPGTWRGSLTMPILGGNPVRLAGTGFHAAIHKGLPQDE